MKRIIIYVVVAAILYFVISKALEKGKYMSYLRSLGFGIADMMTFDEVKTSYIYLHDFARTNPTGASQALRAYSPTLWAKAKAIADKYKIFNL